MHKETEPDTLALQAMSFFMEERGLSHTEALPRAPSLPPHLAKSPRTLLMPSELLFWNVPVILVAGTASFSSAKKPAGEAAS